MLVKYYFKIKYIKDTDNIKADILSRKVKLQRDKKIKGVILRIDKDSRLDITIYNL